MHVLAVLHFTLQVPASSSQHIVCYPILQVDVTEYTFKLALLQRKYEQVIAMIKSSALCGSAIIAYLQAKGYPEVRQMLLLLLVVLCCMFGAVEARFVLLKLW
jgi:hypothetical protein